MLTNTTFFMNLDKFYKILDNTPLETKQLVNRNIDISNRIHYLLQTKFEGKQKNLAAKLNKSEAEVSKMINGLQNFTMKTITKLEVAFGEPILAVVTIPEVDCNVEYVTTSDFIVPKNIGVSMKGTLTEYKKDNEEVYDLKEQPLAVY